MILCCIKQSVFSNKIRNKDDAKTVRIFDTSTTNKLTAKEITILDSMIMEIYQSRNRIKTLESNPSITEYQILEQNIPHIRKIFKQNKHRKVQHLSTIPLNIIEFIMNEHPHDKEKIATCIAKNFMKSTNSVSNIIIKSIKNEFLNDINLQINNPNHHIIDYIKLRSAGITRNQIGVIKDVVMYHISERYGVNTANCLLCHQLSLQRICTVYFAIN